MARGRHYAKLSLSNAPRLSFSDLCILLFLFLSLCRFFCCVFVFFFCSHWSLVDVPLIFFCPADHVPDWQPRVLLGMVEARSVNVKKTTTTKHKERTAGVMAYCIYPGTYVFIKLHITITYVCIMWSKRGGRHYTILCTVNYTVYYTILYTVHAACTALWRCCCCTINRAIPQNNKVQKNNDKIKKDPEKVQHLREEYDTGS